MQTWAQDLANRGEHEKPRDMTEVAAGHNRWKCKHLANVTEHVLKDCRISQVVIGELHEKWPKSTKGEYQGLFGENHARPALPRKPYQLIPHNYLGSLRKFGFGLSKTRSNAEEKQG